MTALVLPLEVRPEFRPRPNRSFAKVYSLGRVLHFEEGHMREEQLRRAREHVADSTGRWNILLAQTDRDNLLAIVDALLAEKAALEDKLHALTPPKVDP